MEKRCRSDYLIYKLILSFSNWFDVNGWVENAESRTMFDQ